MKKAVLILFLVSSSFAFDLGFDTLNARDYGTIYNDSDSDSLRFDSAGVDLIKSEIDQYQLDIFCFNEKREWAKTFYLSNHLYSSQGKFQLEIPPNDSVRIFIEGLDYCMAGCIPVEVGPVYPPRPMQAKMVLFSNRGKDSIVINGMQTDQPLSNEIINREKYVIKSTGMEKAYYAINGRRIHPPSMKSTVRYNGVGIVAEKFSDGRITYKKTLLKY